MLVVNTSFSSCPFWSLCSVGFFSKPRCFSLYFNLFKPGSYYKKVSAILITVSMERFLFPTLSKVLVNSLSSHRYLRSMWVKADRLIYVLPWNFNIVQPHPLLVLCFLVQHIVYLIISRISSISDLHLQISILPYREALFKFFFTSSVFFIHIHPYWEYSSNACYFALWDFYMSFTLRKIGSLRSFCLATSERVSGIESCTDAILCWHHKLPLTSFAFFFFLLKGSDAVSYPVCCIISLFLY